MSGAGNQQGLVVGWRNQFAVSIADFRSKQAAFGGLERVALHLFPAGSSLEWSVGQTTNLAIKLASGLRIMRLSSLYTSLFAP